MLLLSQDSVVGLQLILLEQLFAVDLNVEQRVSNDKERARHVVLVVQVRGGYRRTIALRVLDHVGVWYILS